MKDPRLSRFPNKVGESNKGGYIGGTVRYRLIAEEVSMDEMFKTQETK